MYETGSTQEELAETYDLENPVIEHTETKNFFDHTGLFHKGLNRALTEHELDETLIPDDWWEVISEAVDYGLDEEIINRSAGVVGTFGYRKAR